MFNLTKIAILSLFITLVSCKVVELNEDTWTDLLENEWMVEFFAPWCPACKNLEPIWNDFGSWSNDLSIKVAKVDVVKNPGLSGRFFVTALPTIFHVKNGEFRRYSGSRDMNAFMSFVEEKKWQSIDKVEGWKSPDGVMMSILSWFFKLSHFLKELNNTLLEHYGLPTWVSYGLFAIVTIILGAVVGLILVCIIDLIWPQKEIERQSFAQVQEKEKLIKRSNEIINEDLVDDTGNADEAEEEEEVEEEDNDDDDTSEAEKNSGSDDEENEKAEEEVEEDKHAQAQPKSSPEVRKRRTRKAD